MSDLRFVEDFSEVEEVSSLGSCENVFNATYTGPEINARTGSVDVQWPADDDKDDSKLLESLFEIPARSRFVYRLSPLINRDSILIMIY